ncbi:hypothetical protein [Sphingobium yanoikuyae]
MRGLIRRGAGSSGDLFQPEYSAHPFEEVMPDNDHSRKTARSGMGAN